MFDLDKSGIETEFIEAGDLRFEVLTCGDQKSDRLALLLHGFPEHAYSWRYQMPVLANLGYKVWAPNQRKSSGFDSSPWRLLRLPKPVAGMGTATLTWM